jgi:hypothetical protein
MKTHTSHVNRLAAAMAGLTVLAATASAAAAVTEQVEPAEITLGQTAQLTITASGDTETALAPPVIPGLEFVAVGQSSQTESINGQTSTTSSVIYQVTPQRAGIYTIPAVFQGSQPQLLRVLPANAGSGAALSNNAGASALPPAVVSGLAAGTTRLTPDGSAFVRLRLPKHQLYVGESIPVDIQVGMREGLVASLNGLPTLNGDSFTLNKLSTQPDRTDEVIGGRPFTVLTWHSLLAAVKPGALSLRIETPLTVRMQSRSIAPADALGDSDLNNFFNDPFFQNFFGGTTEKDITVATTPAEFNVLALPSENRPVGFSGAVGTFKVSSELSTTTVTAGDPVTLQLRVTGAGNFDRVNSAMLGSVNHWKTYAPTSSFTAADNAGYHGSKVFEQPLIAAQPGDQTLPGMAFSYFDPDTGRYETVRTATLSVAVSPLAAAGGLVTITPAPIVGAASTVTGGSATGGLRPNHIETAKSSTSLVPPFFRPGYLSLPGVLTVAFSGAWLLMRRREQASNGDNVQRAERMKTPALLAQIDRAAATGDAIGFFNSARTAVQQTLAARWQVSPESITPESMESRLGTDGTDMRRLFDLADEAAYSGTVLEPIDSQKWRQVVLRQVEEITPS